MPGDAEYKVSPEELEHECRVRPEDRVESVKPVVVPAADPRGPHPDWFAAGGWLR